ncbi:hypothetical protein ABFS83_05G125800 [Erythranthe nasuta]
MHAPPVFKNLTIPNISLHPHVGINGGAGSSSAFRVENRSPIFSHGISRMAVVPSGSRSGAETVNKMRGRPRKYVPDRAANMSLGLSPVSAATPSSERIASGERARKVRPPGTWWKQKLAPLGEWMNASAGLAFTRHVLHIGVGEDSAAKMCTTKTEMFMHHVRVVLRYCGCPVRTCSLKVAGPAIGQVASASVCSPDGHMIGAIGGSLIAANPVQNDVVSTSPLTCSPWSPAAAARHRSLGRRPPPLRSMLSPIWWSAPTNFDCHIQAPHRLPCILPSEKHYCTSTSQVVIG